jgi:hypothetical protein
MASGKLVFCVAVGVDKRAGWRGKKIRTSDLGGHVSSLARGTVRLPDGFNQPPLLEIRGMLLASEESFGFEDF